MPSRRRRHDNYAFLLAGLLLLFLFMPLLHTFAAIRQDSFVVRIGLLLGYSSLMLIGVWSLIRQHILFKVGLILALISAVFAVSGVFFHHIVIEVGAPLVVLCFSVMSAVIAVKHVFGSATVDRNLLLGAMCVYLLLGLIWAILYGIVLQFLPASFNGIDAIGESVPFYDLLYYSFVTLAGLGYGDITPLTPIARTLAYLEVIIGQFYIAVMLAQLVGLYLKDRGE